MALFQPMNIIPSSFTVGVVDVNDPMQISWQVNGDSALNSFSIEFYENNEQSTRIKGADVVVQTMSGFYGTDRFGHPKMFTWEADNGKTWHDYNNAFTNGKEYKFKIEQRYLGGEVKQIEFNAFKTRTTPQVLIYLTDSTYHDGDTPLDDGKVLDTSIGYFRADYTQEQGDAVRNVRWQIATASHSNNQWQIGEIISDTGEVPTPTLQFEFNGFFNEGMYAVRCMIESESGQLAKNPLSSLDGWIFFSIAIVDQGQYNGDFTLTCIPKENAALLKWTSSEIHAVADGRYSLTDGAVNLDPYTTIKWGIEGGFDLHWAIAIEYDLQTTETFQIAGSGLQPYSRTFQAKGLIQKATVGLSGGSYSDPVISPDKKSCTVTINPNSSVTFGQVVLEETPFGPTGPLLTVNMGETSLSLAGVLDENRNYYISIPPSYMLNVSWQNRSDKITVILRSDQEYLRIYKGGMLFGQSQLFLGSYNSIKDIAISGGVDGARFRCITVYKGSVSDEVLDSLYSDADFKPSWYAANYKLYMTANFDGNIDGGEVAKFRLYRQEVGKNSLQPIFYAKDASILQVKDYGIVSRKSYTYWLYEYDKNDAYLKGSQCKFPGSDVAATISTSFKNYSLLVCDYDSVNDAYHVRKQYLFALNLSAGSEGNNNTPTLNKNFTPYPTRMPDTANYISGTLQGLIGAIYTVPALVEQIGGFKHTAKPSTLDYFDSVDLEKELYALSTAPYQLFLRDMAGHLRMISTSNQIGMTPDLKKRQIPKSISFPWVEIGDASDVTIIQTPDDYGWNNDEQVLDVRLDADPTTGVLSAYYPKPYDGTRFYLTGVHKEILAAKTPIGITPAQFKLSETATKPDDGIVTATAKINVEEGD